MYKKLTFLFLLIFLFGYTLDAKISIPSIWGNGMVIQQKSTNTMRGTASPNKTVTLQTSWDKNVYTAKSNSKGEFEISFQTPIAGGTHKIEVSDGEVLVLEEILIGDVWLCSGQSNMEMPVKGYRGQPAEHAQETIINADSKQPLRLFTVKRDYSTTPKSDFEGEWFYPDPKSVGDFSAAAYYFGDKVQRVTTIPVGLIHASWGASKIETWMDVETLRQYKEIDLSVLNREKFEYPQGAPTLLFNAMIKPLEGLSIKGVIWYQGEANNAAPDLYRQLFSSWAKQWRTFFKQENMPIYFVEIAPFKASGKDETEWALFREAQLKCMQDVPNTGMVTTNDIGNENFIHPPKKKEIGERLAFWALAKTYEIDGIPFCGPIFKSYNLKNDKIEIIFDYGSDGLNPENAEVIGFEIAGKDGAFIPAKAKIINGTNRVEVWHDSIPHPAEIRYCFRNFMEGNLTGNTGIPAAGFRTKIQ